MVNSDEIKKLYEVFKTSTGVCTDTRKVLKGNVFFALKGGNFNGNLYAKKALDSGCVFAVVDEDIEGLNSGIENLDSGLGLNFLKVDDVLLTLQQLANYHRKQFDVPVIAMSGSNGKTTSKELLYAVLSQKFKVHATKGNLNNHIGVPLTLLSAPIDSEILIVEMGANHQKEITFLCEIAEPDFAFLTNIGKAHLDGFGGLEGVKIGKTELYNYCNYNKNKVFFNNNEQSLQEFSLMPNEVIKYGVGTSVDVVGVQQNETGLSVELTINELVYKADTQLFGEYNVNNVLSAVAIGNYFNVDANDMMKALSSYQPDSNRSQIKTTAKGNKLILDAYNANPTSMTNAIQQFSKTADSSSCYFLGDMLELGDLSRKEHEAILVLLSKLVGRKFLVGKEFFAFKEQYDFKFYLNTLELFEELKNDNLVNTDILIKGSRGIALEKIVELL